MELNPAAHSAADCNAAHAETGPVCCMWHTEPFWHGLYTVWSWYGACAAYGAPPPDWPCMLDPGLVQIGPIDELHVLDPVHRPGLAWVPHVAHA